MRIASRLLIIGTLMGLISAQSVWADVVPGDVIDKSNFQKIEGLVPDYIVKWTKEGDLTMKIGELAYKPEDFLADEFKDKSNTGKYKIDENNCIRVVKDGTIPHPHDIKGFPFPEPDISDPTAPMQMLYNFIFWEFYLMPFKTKNIWFSVNRQGIENRFEVEQNYVIFPRDYKYAIGEINRFLQPFEQSGIGSMSVYYMDPLKDGLRYVFAPSLGRVKRMSHRLAGSEINFAGLDLYPDNAWGGGPRTGREEGRYKFLREQVALVPYIEREPAKAVINKKGEVELDLTHTGNKVLVGADIKGWNGAPWHISPLIWVKRSMYVFEIRSVNPNYRFGKCEGWVEKDTFMDVYKRITDVNGDLWVGYYYSQWAIQSEDGKFHDKYRGGQVVVDMKSDHGSVFLNANRDGGSLLGKRKKTNKNLFTRAGFVKFTR